MQNKRRISWLPDFAKGKGAAALAVFGICWVIAAVCDGQSWLVTAIGVVIAIKGILRSIENSKQPKQKPVKVFKAAKENFAAFKSADFKAESDSKKEEGRG